MKKFLLNLLFVSFFVWGPIVCGLCLSSTPHLFGSCRYSWISGVLLVVIACMYVTTITALPWFGWKASLLQGADSFWAPGIGYAMKPDAELSAVGLMEKRKMLASARLMVFFLVCMIAGAALKSFLSIDC